MTGKAISWFLCLETAAASLLAVTAPARAQEAAENESAVSVAPQAGAEARAFTPADFARFAPRNAYDMLEQVPGFRIDSGQSGDRGLGQASGNVLINGQRPSSKSESTREQLRRIAIDDVVRIEIVDGTTLDIPGLTGQVANVVVESAGLSGQYEYRAQYRQVGDTSLAGGSVSVTGALGNLDYTLSAAHDEDPGASRGDTLRYDSDGALFETRSGENRRFQRVPRIAANLRWRGGDLIANLNTNRSWSDFESVSDEIRTAFGGGNVRLVDTVSREDQARYELGGDLAFPLVGGQLKLIALARGEDSDYVSDQVILARDTDLSAGSRFALESETGERIGRAEYTFSGGGADWQLAAEAAFNTLDQIATLFDIGDDGTLTPIAFPEGAGGVSEDRYEASLSYGRPLTGNLSLQAILGAEQSTLTQTGAAALSRSFFRPKGSVSLAWSPRADIGLDLRVRRRVGQLDFGDFLAQVFLGDERENAGNSDLRPPQSWEVEIEARKDFGRWGNATLRLFDYRIEDLIDIVLVNGGESPGNIASARRTGAAFNGTLELVALGLAGAKIDAEFEWQKARLDDPLTGDRRAISNADPYRFDIEYRHDIPGSPLAYGASVNARADEPFFRITELGFEREGPFFGGVFVEHKDVFGLTVNLRVGNPWLGTDTSTRTVFAGPRDGAPVLFVEERDREYGRQLRLSVKGSF